MTDKDGNAVCGTTSSFASEPGFDAGNTYIPTFTNINSNAQAYFGGLGIVGSTYRPTLTTTTTRTNTYTYDDATPPYTTTVTNTATITSQELLYVNSDGKVLSNTEKPTGVVISLVTPFAYAPERGAKGEIDEGHACLQVGSAVDFGYVPQSLIDFLASDARYTDLYPGIGSCLPGGPSIIQITECSSVLPIAQEAGGDLTSGTVIYVTPEQANKPTTVAAPAPVTSDKPTTSKLPDTQPSPTKDTPTTTNEPETQPAPTNDTPPTTRVPTIGPALPTDINPTTQEPETQPQPTTAGDTPKSPTSESPVPQTSANPAGNIPPGDNSQPTDSAPIGSIIDSFINPPPASSPVVIPDLTTIPLANVPAGLSGSTTTIDGTPFLVVPTPTTIVPVPAAALPSNIGSTTTISGTPVLVIPSETVIPATALPSDQNLFSVTLISGTPFAIIPSTTIPLPSSSGANVPGKITVIGGTTELVIPGPTTVPVNPNFSVGGRTTVISGTPNVVIANATTVPVGSGYVQASTAVRRGEVEAWMIGGLGVLAVVVFG